MAAIAKPLAGRLPTTPEEYRRAWEESTDVPYGYCWCGCGQATDKWTRTRPDKGWVKGEPKRYLPYHHRFAQRFALPVRERFMTKFEERVDGCWVWTGGADAYGYGKFYWDASDPKMRANRASWRLFRGPIPEGMNVLHHCDNPPCVNPDHLFLGTQLDNSADAKSKDRLMTPKRLARTARGSRHGMAKLTEEQVEEIRRRHAAGGVEYQQLADEFGVSSDTIGKIVRGKLWRGAPVVEVAAGSVEDLIEGRGQ